LTATKEAAAVTRKQVWAVTLAAVVALAGCSSASTGIAPGPVGDRVLAGSATCGADKAAGTITYYTGYQWQASTGILDPIAAAAEGFYHALCLTVALQPGTGNPTASAQLVASGRATVTELGAPSDAITAAANGIPIDAIATYGNTTAETLLTSASITNLTQLDGKTLGYKNVVPPIITAELEKAGVDLSSLKKVSVGYDPTILPRGQVQALTAYKSNEPLQLADAGYKFREWDPDQFGLKGAFNVFDVNESFAKAHPVAVESFLRATFEAYHWCESHTSTCVADAAKHDPTGYNTKLNAQVWQTETREVDTTLLAGHGVGWETVTQWTPEYDLLTQDHLIPKAVDLSSLIDSTYLNAIYHGATLVWPGP
jgi:ABC-type nitrate/sulfonate/bicarbonate transport system substrate-binding protein